METNRTEKIIEAAKSVFAKDISLARFREVIDASFDEAVREAVECECKESPANHIFKQGFPAARKKAAGMLEGECSIEEFFDDRVLAYRKHLADLVRKMEA